MTTTSHALQELESQQANPAIRQAIDKMIDDLIGSFPDRSKLTSDQRRDIIARYTAVLEGNFIYWMTAAYISVKSEEARPIILENLYEEVRDAHPAMLRRFAMAAHAVPTEADSLTVYESLTAVRLFFGKLSGVQSVLAMAFFEGFIQRFMGYLADLATAQGSNEMGYTDVHGVCDIEHTDGLFRALSMEMAMSPVGPESSLFEGVDLLRTMIDNIVFNRAMTA
jgi:hypothetical protein